MRRTKTTPANNIHRSDSATSTDLSVLRAIAIGAFFVSSVFVVGCGVAAYSASSSVLPARGTTPVTRTDRNVTPRQPTPTNEEHDNVVLIPVARCGSVPDYHVRLLSVNELRSSQPECVAARLA